MIGIYDNNRDVNEDAHIYIYNVYCIIIYIYNGEILVGT